jgi:hypothetical protein
LSGHDNHTDLPRGRAPDRARRAPGGAFTTWAGSALAAVLLFGVVALGGCGGRRTVLATGCSTGDQVPAAVRAAIERAAGDFYDRARRGEWHAIYENVAPAVRTGTTEDRFTTPLTRVTERGGFPSELHTESLRVVKFGDGFPYTPHVSCPTPGEDDPTTLLLTRFPVQASLVQTGMQGGERFYYSTLWFQTDGGWKLATFFTKPATIAGRDWRAYDQEAGAQKLAQNLRNAALLYNVAIDLSVPAAWVKPGAVEELQRRQRRISVEGLPSGRIMPWFDPPDTFLVRSVGYTIQPSGLGLIVQYPVRASIADTVAQAAYADRMAAYMRRAFPEYKAEFQTLTLLGYEPKDQSLTWSRTQPLAETR